MTPLDLASLVFLFNVMTFGNGPVMIPLLQESLVDERGVLSVDQLLYAFTVARVTPGQANIYVASIGYMLFGAAGALLALLAIVLPGFLMLPLAAWYHRVSGWGRVRGFTRGLTSASVGLIFAATLDIAGRSLTGWIAWVVFAAALACLQLLRWGTLASLGAASALGLALTFWR